ncbi:Carboxylic ester hydrolase [Mycena indigotica]|uniref:Carboxylic ester hydrolase n=1 Tax=Mycena indigotica TaxID=2126181 RepID=A0A8H6SWQ0_9AGAR|nr:Carboxylic ester hydrolase [Mycena indigotica]KAF7306525.1 Carboxylic ester hydrolase [Mycena indigotica]
MRTLEALVFIASIALCQAAAPVVVSTTSGRLHGLEDSGVMAFKGIRFAQPPVSSLRWEPPVPFVSTADHNTTVLSPSCLQQFPFASAALDEFLFNNPANPPAESEDCLFLNVWAPAPSSRKLPVLVWIYGGALQFGTASLPAYDGVSIVENQKIILVTFNYRLNVLGFPGSPDIPLGGNNLGYLDQELALQWVQLNIAKFGGDPAQVTIMGQSAGSQSVSTALARHAPGHAPFRAAILLSGAQTSISPIPSFSSFNNFSVSVGCSQQPGPARLACLKKVPASAIRNYTNGPTGASFEPIVDNVTVFSDPLSRIRNGLTANVPFIIGNTQNDGSLFALPFPDLTTFLNAQFGPGVLTTAQITPLYPGVNASSLVAEVIKDLVFLCPAELWSGAAVGVGTTVFRYTYGAVFADLQLFPNAGSWHSTELPEIFGTFNRTTATAAEATLSQTMQTVIGNFVKNPAIAPASKWPKYVPGKQTTTLAKLAYNGNVDLSNLVEAVESDSIDGPCDAFWNKFLDVRE